MSDGDGMQTAFGKWLREARKAQRLDQEALAERIGTTAAAISRYERGTRTPRKGEARELAEALGRPVQEAVTALAADIAGAPEMAYQPDPDEQYLLESYRGIDSQADRQLVRDMLDALRRREKNSAIGGRRADEIGEGSEGEDTDDDAPGANPGPNGDLAD